MSFVRIAVVTIVLAACPTASWAIVASKAQPNIRDQEQAACYDDATKLCKDAVPDEDKIAACMRAKFDQVSPACKVFFK